jgi:predicted MPP superfamily phosphohydrolase
MVFRESLFVLFVVLNLFAYAAMRQSVVVWVRTPERRRRALNILCLILLLINIPLALFFARDVNWTLHQIPAPLLKVVFYPSTAWVATILFFFLVGGPVALGWAVVRSCIFLGRTLAKYLRKPEPEASAPAVVSVSRRGFLAGSAGMFVPAIYGVAAYGVYGTLDDLDVSKEHEIPIPYLPRSLEGLTIVQLSDLHVGPYIRERELRRLVHVTNELRPDIVVITGDILDRSMESLPDTVRGLAGIQAALGTFAVLGNHDISTDRYSYSGEHRGGVKIAQAIESIGIRTLRNEVVQLGSGQDRVALMGLDWPRYTSGGNFYSYQQTRTQSILAQMAEAAGPETPRVLLAHHPDTFMDAHPHSVGLTLAGHTHGGGQVILGDLSGVPIGIGMFRFKYLSGLYQEAGHSLYVNRGIGYLGIPIRINCPPEVSRFKLVCPTEGSAPAPSSGRTDGSRNA